MMTRSSHHYHHDPSQHHHHHHQHHTVDVTTTGIPGLDHDDLSHYDLAAHHAPGAPEHAGVVVSHATAHMDIARSSTPHAASGLPAPVSVSPSVEKAGEAFLNFVHAAGLPQDEEEQGDHGGNAR